MEMSITQRQKKQGHLQIFITILVLSAAATFTVNTAAKDAAAPLSIYVVNYPLQYFAERIGGPDVRVSFPAPADGDPAFWRPSPEQVAAYQKADLILLNGASYAKWIARVSLPASRIVDTSASFAHSLIPLNDRVSHSHGLGGKHEHGDLAFTTWLDPVQALAQARAIRDALIRRRPESAADFNQRFDRLAAELKDLDRQLTDVTQASASTPLIFSHPVYQYLTRRYGLNGQAVHWEPDRSPTAQQWAALNGILVNHPAQWMIWEGTPDRQTVGELKKLGLDSLTFDPCGNRPETGDFLSVMQENILNLKKAFPQ